MSGISKENEYIYYLEILKSSIMDNETNEAKIYQQDETFGQLRKIMKHKEKWIEQLITAKVFLEKELKDILLQVIKLHLVTKRKNALLAKIDSKNEIFPFKGILNSKDNLLNTHLNQISSQYLELENMTNSSEFIRKKKSIVDLFSNSVGENTELLEQSATMEIKIEQFQRLVGQLRQEKEVQEKTVKIPLETVQFLKEKIVHTKSLVQLSTKSKKHCSSKAQSSKTCKARNKWNFMKRKFKIGYQPK